MRNDIFNYSIDDEHQHGGLSMRHLPEVKKNFYENAVKVLKETSAAHVCYCHIRYDEDGNVTSASFYSRLSMDDETFYERTRGIPGTDYVGAVHKH